PRRASTPLPARRARGAHRPAPYEPRTPDRARPPPAPARRPPSARYSIGPRPRRGTRTARLGAAPSRGDCGPYHPSPERAPGRGRDGRKRSGYHRGAATTRTESTGPAGCTHGGRRWASRPAAVERARPGGARRGRIPSGIRGDRPLPVRGHSAAPRPPAPPLAPIAAAPQGQGRLPRSRRPVAFPPQDAHVDPVDTGDSRARSRPAANSSASADGTDGEGHAGNGIASAADWNDR